MILNTKVSNEVSLNLRIFGVVGLTLVFNIISSIRGIINLRTVLQ